MKTVRLSESSYLQALWAFPKRKIIIRLQAFSRGLHQYNSKWKFRLRPWAVLKNTNGSHILNSYCIPTPPTVQSTFRYTQLLADAISLTVSKEWKKTAFLLTTILFSCWIFSNSGRVFLQLRNSASRSDPALGQLSQQVDPRGLTGLGLLVPSENSALIRCGLCAFSLGSSTKMASPEKTWNSISLLSIATPSSHWQPSSGPWTLWASNMVTRRER